MISLGIDISTTTAGFCFSEKECRIISCGFVDISNYESKKQKAFSVIQAIENAKTPFNRIVIEQALLGFGGQATSQQTMVKLLEFNAVFSYIAEEHFKLQIIHAHPSTMRKTVFGKANEKGKKSKVYVNEKLIEQYPHFSNYMILNSKGTKEIKQCEDIRDAIVCSFYGLKI